LDVKPVVIKTSIDVESTPADLQAWDAQEKILQNTGIERDGGITNLYTAIESNSLYAETFYCRNGNKVRLTRDDVNNVFRVLSDGRDIGQVPQWGVKRRAVIPSDANDICLTTEDTLLALKITSGVATIEEIDSTNFALIRKRSFTIPSAISDGFFVRNKFPTWASVTSIVGVYASSNKLYHEIILDSGTVYTITGQLGFVNSSQVFAYYENGWIIASNDPSDPRAFLLKSDGTQDGTYTEATFLIANYNQVANTIAFIGWRDPVTLGTPGTYGYTFTPPAALLGSWTVTAITVAATSAKSVLMTFGGIAYIHGTAQALLYANNDSVRSWTINHQTPPEIYGYLDNGADIAFKVHTALGEGSYLSASFDPDGIGEPISEAGEISAYYYPHILKCGVGIIGVTEFYRVVYRRGDNSFAMIEIARDDTFNRLQEIAPGVVKINTISAVCVVDTNNNDLQYGGNAYNGFVVVGYDTSGTTVQKAHIARHRGKYGGSVDTGYKSTAAVLVGAVNLVVIPEGLSFTPNNDTIDVYVGTLPSSIYYYRSIRDGIAQSVKGNLTNTLYVDDSVEPAPIGATYHDRTIDLIGSTAIREANYDGYQLLNEAPGHYDSFVLYSQLYLFDGDWIYGTTLAANVLQALTKLAPALGLVFIAEAPTAIYFISDFDNSLYTFDGGQSVNKAMRINRRTDILAATYNVRENTLALFGIDFVLWLRDGILSEVTLPIAYPFDIFSTDDGIWIAKDYFAIKYMYNAIAGTSTVVIALDLDGGEWGTAYADTYDGGTWGTAYADTIDCASWGDVNGVIAPLIWQSKFNGFSDRVKQSIDRYLFRVYKHDKAQSSIEIVYRAYIEHDNITETKTIDIGTSAHPYDDDGYAYVEFVPANKNAIASSIQLTINDKIVLLDGFANVGGGPDMVAKNRG